MPFARLGYANLSLIGFDKRARSWKCGRTENLTKLDTVHGSDIESSTSLFASSEIAPGHAIAVSSSSSLPDIGHAWKQSNELSGGDTSG